MVLNKYKLLQGEELVFYLRYCILNKSKEVHLKILHKIYPVYCPIAKSTDVDMYCISCKQSFETTPHL